MEKKQVSIREPNADVFHDFPFKLGQEVIIDGDGNTGIVADAIWEGNDNAPATHYTITYQLKTSDGGNAEMKRAELLGLNRK